MGKSKDTTSKEIDPMALHRKLEPLYELLDKGNNKAALKGATQLLAKHPNLQIARALKGIALYRSGKKDEGVAICDEIKDEGPEDDNTLHTLQVFYRNAGMPSSIVSMFEAASARDPKNLEHLSLLFSAHARDFAFVKQQQCAMKLYRLTNDPKHVMWAVCGILLQTRGMTREERRDATLTRLAAGMCAKLEKNGGVTDRETLLVCARVLRECGRGRDARTLLESALAEKCVPMKAERLSLCATQAAEDGDVDDALAHWRGVLKEMPDDWQAASCAMDLTMRGTVAAAPRKAPASAGGDWAPDDAFTAEGVRGGGGDGDKDDVARRVGAMALTSPDGEGVERGETLVRELVAAADEAGGAMKVGRGPYLLEVELAYRKSQLRGSSSTTTTSPPPAGASEDESLPAAMMKYWREFGYWTSCAKDLAPYSRRLLETDADAAAAVRERLASEAAAAAAAAASSDEPANRKLRRAVAAEAIRAQLGSCGGSWRDRRDSNGILGPALPSSSGRTLATDLMTRYREAREVVAGADPREPTPADTLALLAVNALAAEATSHAARAYANGVGGEIDVDAAAEATRALLVAAACASEAVRNSPNHAELRIGLSVLYTLLGAHDAACETHAALDCKNIQMDTMAHLELPHLEGGDDGAALNWFAARSDLLATDAGKDITENGVKAYDNGVYTKALEFVDFHRRLNTSHALKNAAVVKWRAALREAVVGDAAAGAKPELVFNVLRKVLRGAADACEPLPTRGADWPSSCFNEDLCTNPAFYPPHGGLASLAAADWWRSRGVDASPRAGAETPVAGVHDVGVGAGASVAHRARWQRAMRRRVVEIHAMRAAAGDADADAVDAVAAAAEALFATDADADADAAVAPSTRACDAASNAMLRALLDIARAEDDEREGRAASLDALAASIEARCDDVRSELRRGGGATLDVTCGGVVAATTHLVSEIGAGAFATLASASSAAAKGGANGAADAAVATAARRIKDALAGVVAAASAFDAGDATAAAADVSARCGGAADEDVLREVLKNVAAAHEETFEAVATRGGRLIAHLGAIADAE